MIPTDEVTKHIRNIYDRRIDRTNSERHTGSLRARYRYQCDRVRWNMLTDDKLFGSKP